MNAHDPHFEHHPQVTWPPHPSQPLDPSTPPQWPDPSPSPWTPLPVPKSAPGGWRSSRQKPPWWPEDEPWPPREKKSSRGPRSFLGKVGCFFVAMIGLMFAASIVGAVFFDHGGRRGGDGPAWGVIILILIIGGIFYGGRTVRRTAAPIAEVMTAAERVAEGDYAVRVETRADGDVGRLVETFNAMTTRLEVNEAQRRNLFADVAHELRTPLSVIRGNTEGMLDGVYPRDDAHLEIVLDATALMARLLDDLRTLSLTDTGTLRLHKEQTDIDDLMAEIRYAFASRAADAGVTFTLAVQPVPALEIDPVRIRQVLENLLNNALRHTPRGGSIRVEVSVVGRDALFRIADTGHGISPEALPHIFDRFWKSADSGGSGLGLAIARGLIEAHGGQIRADSVQGRGTVLSFTLPLR